MSIHHGRWFSVLMLREGFKAVWKWIAEVLNVEQVHLDVWSSVWVLFHVKTYREQTLE